MKRFIKRMLIAGLMPLHALARTLRLVRPGIAVLMYHSVGEQEWEFTVTPNVFRRQLALLETKGFCFLDSQRFKRMLDGKEPVPPRSALITFDDGYRDIIEGAMPALVQRGIRPVLYVHTSRNGYALGNEFPLLTWDEIRNMRDSTDIGSHSHAHPVLRQLTPDALEADLSKSVTIFEGEMGQTPRTFAYPGGKYNDAVIDALRSHGFTTAFTITHGLVRSGDDIFRLRRIGVTAHTSDLELYAHAVGVGEWYGAIVGGMKSFLHF